MKNLMIGILILGMVFNAVGCCTRVDPTTQATTKSFGNCLTTAQQILCNPTDQQKAAAAAALAFITSGIDIANIVVPVPITAAEVQLVFSAVPTGGFVLTSAMMEALAWYAAVTVKLQDQAAAQVKAGKKAPVALPPNIDPLYVW